VSIFRSIPHTRLEPSPVRTAARTATASVLSFSHRRGQVPRTHLHRTCSALQAVSPRRAGASRPERGAGVRFGAGVAAPPSVVEGAFRRRLALHPRPRRPLIFLRIPPRPRQVHASAPYEHGQGQPSPLTSFWKAVNESHYGLFEHRLLPIALMPCHSCIVPFGLTPFGPRLGGRSPPGRTAPCPLRAAPLWGLRLSRFPTRFHESGEGDEGLRTCP